jgi:hypothetical protein
MLGARTGATHLSVGAARRGPRTRPRSGKVPTGVTFRPAGGTPSHGFLNGVDGVCVAKASRRRANGFHRGRRGRLGAGRRGDHNVTLAGPCEQGCDVRWRIQRLTSHASAEAPSSVTLWPGASPHMRRSPVPRSRAAPAIAGPPEEQSQATVCPEPLVVMGNHDRFHQRLASPHSPERPSAPMRASSRLRWYSPTASASGRY